MFFSRIFSSKLSLFYPQILLESHKNMLEKSSMETNGCTVWLIGLIGLIISRRQKKPLHSSLGKLGEELNRDCFFILAYFYENCK